MLQMILFDLDGTLLPMDQDVFTKTYFKYLAAKLQPRGYQADQLVGGIWDGTAAMVKNDGNCTNEEAFWRRFAEIFGEQALSDRPLIDEYYRQEFQRVAEVCGCNPLAKAAVDELKQRGYRVALATNPIFPAVATESRIRWAGLDPEDFELYTTYENTCYSKPNPDYYRDLLQRLDCAAGDCLMVGNDVEEDMVAANVGMKVFLLTDCLINKKNREINAYPHGGFPELLQYLKQDLAQ